MALTAEAIAKGGAAITARALAREAELEPVIRPLRNQRIRSAYGIAKALNKKGVPTARGSGGWQVKWVLDRL